MSDLDMPFEPARTALMLIDLQNDFLHPDGAYGRAGAARGSHRRLTAASFATSASNTRCRRLDRVHTLHACARQVRHAVYCRAFAPAAPVSRRRRLRAGRLGARLGRRACAVRRGDRKKSPTRRSTSLGWTSCCAEQASIRCCFQGSSPRAASPQRCATPMSAICTPFCCPMAAPAFVRRCTKRRLPICRLLPRC